MLPTLLSSSSLPRLDHSIFILPLDALEEIIDAASKDIPTLRSLSLANGQLTRRCQKHIFFNLSLTIGTPSGYDRIRSFESIPRELRLNVRVLSLRYVGLNVPMCKQATFNLSYIIIALVHLRTIHIEGLVCASLLTGPDMILLMAAIRFHCALHETLRLDIRTGLGLPGLFMNMTLTLPDDLQRILPKMTHNVICPRTLHLPDESDRLAASHGTLDSFLWESQIVDLSSLQSLHCSANHFASPLKTRYRGSSVTHLTVAPCVLGNIVDRIPIELFKTLAVLTFELDNVHLVKDDISFYFDLVRNTVERSTPALAFRELHPAILILEQPDEESTLQHLRKALPAIERALLDEYVFPQLVEVEVKTKAYSVRSVQRLTSACAELMPKLVRKGVFKGAMLPPSATTDK